jgi:hypothetical protein
MDLAEFYPAPRDLIKSELSVLDHLRNSTYINQKHPRVASDAAIYLARNKESPSGFEFHSYFDIWHAPAHRRGLAGPGRPSNPNVRLTVSVLISLDHGAFTNVTYCLSVCRIRATNPDPRVSILRKFHFDITVEGDQTQRRFQQHPQSHLQYCGEMVPYMTTVGCKNSQLEQLHPWLSEPRILFWPMSLALLIDMALHEFQDQDSARFRGESHWRGLVRSQEALVLRPFCEKCIHVIEDTREENRTLAEAFYVG